MANDRKNKLPFMIFTMSCLIVDIAVIERVHPLRRLVFPLGPASRDH